MPSAKKRSPYAPRGIRGPVTAQKLFNRVALHLLRQGHRAYSERGCQYLLKTGDSCSVGCLVPVAIYRPAMECRPYLTWSELKCKSVKRWLRLLDDFKCLLADLQHIHDNTDIPDWRTKLAGVAKLHGLSARVLQNV